MVLGRAGKKLGHGFYKVVKILMQIPRKSEHLRRTSLKTQSSESMRQF
jgi:hypothetical protein